MWERLRPYRPAFYRRVLPLMTLGLLLGLGAWTAERRVRQLPRFQVHADQLAIENRPEWLSLNAEQEINRKTFRACAYSIFDPELTGKIRKAFEGDPWVLRVEAVSKHFPNQVKVRLMLRKPLARLSLGQHLLLLDRDGRVLDILPVEMQSIYAYLPEILGVSASPPKRGDFWESPELMAALEPMEVLSNQNLLAGLKVAAVDVSNLKGRMDARESEVVLYCQGDVRILWGRPQGAYGEIPVEAKLEKIRALLHEAQGVGGVDWNVRFENGGIIRRGATPTAVSRKR